VYVVRPDRILIACILAAVIILFGRAATADADTNDSNGSIGPPVITIHRDASGLSIAGEVSSSAHEAILRDLARLPENSAQAVFDIHEGLLTPPGWALVTEFALRAALLTNFSETSVTVDGVFIRGVTSDAREWTAGLARLEKALLPGMKLQSGVVSVAPADNFEALCRLAFDALTKDKPIEFAIASSAIGSNALSLLDGLVETAADCPGAIIGVRARGDGAESVTANRALGDARAASIADYLTKHGLDADRISLLSVGDRAVSRSPQVTFTLSFYRSDVSGAANR
jgi:hypothetical protein